MNTITAFLGNVLYRFKGANIFNYIAGLEDDVESQYSSGQVDMSESANNASSKQFWKELVTTLAKIADWLIPVMMIIIGMAGSIYAIVLGVNYAKAESDEKKSEAKKKFLNALLGIGFGLLIMLIFMLILKNAGSINNWIMGTGHYD